MMKRAAIIALCAATTSVGAADIVKSTAPVPPAAYEATPLSSVSGRASVIDGRTLWFPQTAQRVRLADIDACELPQWALDPDWKDRKAVKAPNPVPCGPLAKAWLSEPWGRLRLNAAS